MRGWFVVVAGSEARRRVVLGHEPNRHLHTPRVEQPGCRAPATNVSCVVARTCLKASARLSFGPNCVRANLGPHDVLCG